jgi:hypothetical protein
MSNSDRAFWLSTSASTAASWRCTAPGQRHGPSTTQYLLDNDAWGTTRTISRGSGSTPAAIGACPTTSASPNIAVFVTADGIALGRAPGYNWMYVDAGSGWGHRHAILWYPYDDNGGPTGKEGFLGIGRANGGPYQGPFSQPWNFAEMIVMNVFDPCASWDYNIPVMDNWIFLPLSHK